MLKYKAYILFVCLILGCSVSLVAQPTQPAKLPDFAVQNVSDLSFSSGNINSIVQDQEGFIWYGSWDGLFMYNGYSVRSYKVRHGYSDCFKGRKVRAIYSDSKGRLWVGSNLQGLHLFDRDTQCFRQFIHENDNPQSIPENDIMGIWEDSRQNIWIATTYGFISKIQFADSGNVIFHSYEFRQPGIDFLSISNVIQDKIWITTNRGVIKFDMKDPGTEGGEGKFIFYDKKPFNQAFDAVYYHSGTDSLDHILFGSTEGMYACQFKNDSLFFQELFQVEIEHTSSLKNKINALYRSSLDNTYIWMGTDDGVYAFDLKRKILHQPEVWPTTINDDIEKANQFFEDNSGVIWVGTNKGIYKIDKFGKSFRFISIITGQPNQASEIRSLIHSGDGQIFLGTYGQGIAVAQNINETFNNLTLSENDLSLKYVNTLLIDKNENLWVGTDGNGIYLIEGENLQSNTAQIKRKFEKANSSLSDDYIVCSLLDSKGNIWFGTYQGGLNLYDRETKEFVCFDQLDGQQRLSASPIVKLFEDNDEHLWVGTRGNGIFQLNIDELEKGKKISYAHFQQNSEDGYSLPDNFITDIYQDNQGIFWIGTESGMCLLDAKTNKTLFYTTINGFPGEVVQSITSVQENEFWVSTKKSIIKIQREEQSFSAPLSFQEYKYSDGLGNSFFHSNAVITIGEEILFGGADGITIFNPGQIRNNPSNPTVVFTNLLLNYENVPIGDFNNRKAILHKSINQTSEITLEYFDNNITIEFAALHYAAPEKNIYKFKLEGFDNDWINTNADRRFAHYSNLDAGDYIFKVRAANNDGVWSNKSKVLKIKVLPPFWLTYWAYAVYGLLIVALFLLIRKITLTRIQLRHNVEIERLERERADEIHNLELQYFTNISHEIRTPLTLILGPLEKLLNTDNLNVRMLNQLQVMQQHGQRLHRLLNQLMDFRRLGKRNIKLKAAEGNIVKFVKEIFISFRETAKDRHINYQFGASKDELNMFFDRDLLEKVLYNLLSNAFKYSNDGGEINVQLSVASKDQIELESKENFSVCEDVYACDYLKLKVADTGQGISKENLSHIFDRFFRADSQNDKSTIGTGIGLALTKDLVLLHKGIITVNSQLNNGSEFTLYIPLGKDHLLPDEIIHGFTDSEHLNNYELKYSSKIQNIVQSKEMPEDAYRILIVEDNGDVRNFIKGILSDQYVIIEASNGKEGFKISKEEVPDLIISDVMMPEMDGIEMCSKIKSDEATSHIPVILLTARTSLIFKVEGIETGADDYITKPFSPEYLLARIKNLIDQRISLKRRFSDKFYVKPKEIALNSLDEEFLNKVIDVINERMSDSEFSIDEMCKNIGMSRMQLYRKLKALTGLSANEFLRTQRIQRAAQLLEQDQLTIAQITYEVGFNDLKYFRSRFTEHFKMTPSDYAKKQKLKSET